MFDKKLEEAIIDIHDAISVLNNCKIVNDNIIKLPDIKLPDNIFKDVKKAIEKIGGKWKGGKIYGFVFDSNPNDLLKSIQTGEKRNIYKELQFYPTPHKLALKAAKHIKFFDNMEFCEPSAGEGNLIDAFKELNNHPFNLTCLEIDDNMRKRLKEKYNPIYIGKDFLETDFGDKKFDVIFANPPYSKNQDIKHITKMIDICKDDGQVVTFLSAHFKNVDLSEPKNKTEKDFVDMIFKYQFELINIDVKEWENNGAKAKTVLLILTKSLK